MQCIYKKKMILMLWVLSYAVFHLLHCHSNVLIALQLLQRVRPDAAWHRDWALPGHQIPIRIPASYGLQIGNDIHTLYILPRNCQRSRSFNGLEQRRGFIQKQVLFSGRYELRIHGVLASFRHDVFHAGLPKYFVLDAQLKVRKC